MVGAQSFAALRASSGSESLFFESSQAMMHTVLQRSWGVALTRKGHSAALVHSVVKIWSPLTIANILTHKFRLQ